LTQIKRITTEAKIYALKELARRAGVTSEIFRTWQTEVQEGTTTVRVLPGTEKRIRFPATSPDCWRQLAAGTFETTRASWMHSPLEPISSMVPDLVIPFPSEARTGKRPLFSSPDPDCVECSYDLLTSIVLTLSRFEETVSTEKDPYGRFKASTSLAFRGGFLNRPIIDEYGLAFGQALTALLPSWRPQERRLRVKLSHDIDDVGQPFKWRAALRHARHHRRPSATLRDLFGPIVGMKPTNLELVRQLARMSLERDLDSAMYWKASPPGPRDTGYDPRHYKVQEVISWLREREVEIGIHPGYETFLAPDRLLQEIRVLREVVGEQPMGGRQHLLRWCPETWLHWESCGLAYDSTVGYADRIGFRAGTCIPYRPWLISQNREARLIEIPLLVMEVTLAEYMGLTPQQSLDAILECVARCRLVGGVFTLLWHNSSLIDPIYGDVYEKALDALAHNEKFDWRNPSRELY
jgi:transposase-like protein